MNQHHQWLLNLIKERLPIPYDLDFKSDDKSFYLQVYLTANFKIIIKSISEYDSTSSPVYDIQLVNESGTIVNQKSVTSEGRAFNLYSEFLNQFNKLTKPWQYSIFDFLDSTQLTN